MNNVSVKFAFIMILTVFAGAYEVKSAQDATASVNKSSVKYVFLFIGDGMGDNHKILAEQAFQNGHPGARLFMTRLPVQAKSITLNSEKQITDSAAAGTAIACGVKTTNSKLGLDPAGNSATSVAVMAKQKGMKVGIISTSALNDATPAAFYAHVNARGQFKDIVGDMAASGFDFFGGGKLYLDKTSPSEADFAGKLKAAGYSILDGKSGLRAATQAKCYVQTPVYWVIDTKNPDIPTLAEYTLKASEVLDNPQGFFVMVEGGRIDHASHGNDAGAMIQELFAFDNAVKTGMEFQQKHPDDTLIVVTADHETGGLTLADDMQAQKAVILKQKASYGSILEDLKKIKNTENNFEPAFDLVKGSLGYDVFSASELADLKAVWLGDSKDKYKAFLSLAFKIRDLHCGVKWTTGGHSATPVTTAASGKGQELFAGNGENIAIFSNLKQLISGCPP
ncbi:MAG: alkaline phosphatase [Lentisphaerota bacterium]